MLKDLVIFQRMQDYLLWIHGVVSSFPRSEKYNLGGEIKRLALAALRLVIRANYEVEKTETLCRVIVGLDLQQVLLRNAKLMGVLDNRRYETAARSLLEIRKLLIGWMKSEKRRKAQGKKIDRRNVFGNFYLSLKSLDNDRESEPERAPDLLREGLKDVNRKMEERKATEKGGPAESETKKAQGLWLFSDPEK